TIRPIGGLQGSIKRSTKMAKAEVREPRPQPNPLKTAERDYIDYKDVALLRKFISDRGKIRARRVTGVTVQQERNIAQAIKDARDMALLPYSGSGRYTLIKGEISWRI